MKIEPRNIEGHPDDPISAEEKPHTEATGVQREPRDSGEAGQATAEYALVMLAAAGLAGSLLAWAVGTDAIARLMDAVVDSLIGQAT